MSRPSSPSHVPTRPASGPRSSGFGAGTGVLLEVARAIKNCTGTRSERSHRREAGAMDQPAEYAGVIGPTWRESTPWWPPEPSPPAGAPNVLLVVLDDVGFAQLGCYGSDIATPNIDGLASGGVRLANFHTTSLCSPTRACLLTGRNHHRNGMGRIADLALGYPGYSGRIPRENLFVSEILAAHGYAAYAVGKWHLTP